MPYQNVSEGPKKVFYSLVVFDCRIDLQTATVIRVDVQAEVTPNLPDSGCGLSNLQMVRWRAMLALDLDQPPRESVALMAEILSWRLAGPPPPLVINGKSVAEMKLETMPDVTRLATGLVGVKMVITEVANCGSRGEKGGAGRSKYFQDFKIFFSSEILTRLEDEVISDEKWELKIFQVWTVPVDGRVKYNILVFQVVGVMVWGVRLF